MTTKNPLIESISEAQNALPYSVRKREGFEDPQFLPKRAASMRTLTLKETSVRVDRNGQIIVGTGGNMAGETITIEQAIAKNSRFAQAGGTLVFMPDHFQPQIIESASDTKTMVLRSEPVSFSVVDAAGFVEVTDEDGEAPDEDVPVFVETISRTGQRSFGVRHKITRAQQKARGDQVVADEVLASILAGVTRVIDRLATEAILATTPTAFTLAKAATAGVRFGDLKALVGKAANGAEIRADGRLTAQGIEAELTNACTETIVGDFSKAAAVIGPDLQIVISRLNVNGDCHITTWLSVDAVCPAAGKFWTVGA